MSGLVNKIVEGVQNVAIEAQETVSKVNNQNAQGTKEKQGKTSSGAVSALKLPPRPEFIDHRLALFDKLKAEQDAAQAAMQRKEITITLPDGAKKAGTSWETTPMAIALAISQGLADRTIVARVNGQLWDLNRPLEADSSLELLDFESPDGKQVFWHSSAHMLGEATELHYGCHLCVGPPLPEDKGDGFFYEMSMGGAAVEAKDYQPLEEIVSAIVKDKQPFDRLVVSKENLLQMFKHNKYKQKIIDLKVADGDSSTVYRCGPLIDFCRGPHVLHTGKIKSFAIMKNSASYFLNNKENDSLQRIYGVSYPDKKRMTEYKKFLAEAAMRDHRKIGKQQELFFFDEHSPGSCFWLPHGARIYNTLIQFIKNEYRRRGFEEIITPNMYNSSLWKTSGHWQNYSEDMFKFDVESETWALKPMNCPGHCILYKFRERSWRELPLRLADFGVLHRNEKSGALTGLSRVRRFQQDDAHIFCMPGQVKDEIRACFDFMQHVYGILGFNFKLFLSTRPENYLGELATWDVAEAQLEEALNEFSASSGSKWEKKLGDGAFYGPKIDIKVQDAMRREVQCATIQLDFQLPLQFKLEYVGGTNATAAAEKTEADAAATQAQTVTDAKAPITRPVMIHRAIMGSIERMTAMLIEKYIGKWPFWLSPRQAIVIPITGVYYDYAKEVHDVLYAAGFHVELDLSPNTIKKKVLNAQQDSFNFAFIVGETEEKERSVNVRNCRDEGRQERAETVKLDEIVQRMNRLRDSQSLQNEL